MFMGYILDSYNTVSWREENAIKTMTRRGKYTSRTVLCWFIP